MVTSTPKVEAISAALKPTTSLPHNNQNSTKKNMNKLANTSNKKNV